MVICDRYVDSTRAYQGAHGGWAMVDALHRLAIALDPDLTVILDMDPAAALARAGGRTTAPGEDRFERKGAAFQARLREAFRAIAAAEPDRCAVIDAAGPPEDVAEAVWAAVAPRLEPAA